MNLDKWIIINKQVNIEEDVYMYYEIRCEVTEEFTRLVTETMLALYEKYKDDERIFPKKESKEKLTNWNSY